MIPRILNTSAPSVPKTKSVKEDGYDHFSQYEMDYPSRLHYRTGAKLYKVKSGKFHIYWA